MNNNEDVMNTKEIAIGEYNPITGDSIVAANNDNIIDISNAHFNKFTDTNNKDLDIDDLKKIIPFINNNDTINEVDDLITINNLIKKKKSNKKILFDELPTFLKDSALSISAQTVEDAPNLKFLNNKTKLNYISNLLIQNLVEEYDRKNEGIDLDLMLSGFNESINNIQNDMSKEFGNIMMGFDEERKAEIDKAIERCKSEGKEDSIEKLQKMKNTIDSAYNLSDFSEFCKKVKIKKFDLQKPKKVFTSFNAKYMNHANNINDIQYCPIVLDRHLKDHDSNMKVCLAFCKYCMNFSPDNIEEHTFMYYFIRNIILLDRINPKGQLYDSMDEKSKFFYDGFISNIKKCIDNINSKNE